MSVYLHVYVLGLGITRYLTIRYYHDILPTITIISRYSDSVPQLIGAS